MLAHIDADDLFLPGGKEGGGGQADIAEPDHGDGMEDYLDWVVYIILSKCLIIEEHPNMSLCGWIILSVESNASFWWVSRR